MQLYSEVWISNKCNCIFWYVAKDIILFSNFSTRISFKENNDILSKNIVLKNNSNRDIKIIFISKVIDTNDPEFGFSYILKKNEIVIEKNKAILALINQNKFIFKAL